MSILVFTSQPVAAERLLILIKGVFPMAPTRPFLDFLSFWVFLKRALLQMKKESTTVMERAVSVTIAPAVVTGAITVVPQPGSVLLNRSQLINKFVLSRFGLIKIRFGSTGSETS